MHRIFQKAAVSSSKRLSGYRSCSKSIMHALSQNTDLYFFGLTLWLLQRMHLCGVFSAGTTQVRSDRVVLLVRTSKSGILSDYNPLLTDLYLYKKTLLFCALSQWLINRQNVFLPRASAIASVMDVRVSLVERGYSNLSEFSKNCEGSYLYEFQNEGGSNLFEFSQQKSF